MDMENRVQEGSATTLNFADVMAMDAPVRALDPSDRAEIARAAMDEWGFCGVGLRRGAEWAGVMLVSPLVPRGHPLSAAGLPENTAGLILVSQENAPPLGMSKRLCTGLCRRLRAQVSGIEAQADPTGSMTALAPSAGWLAQMGFQPMRYPLNRYRLDFGSMVTWIQKRLSWSPNPAFGLAGQTASNVAQITESIV